MPSHNDTTERLIKMANDIATNNAHYGEDDAAAGVVADHLRRFWSRSMKDEITQYVHNGGQALLPSARRAVELLSDANAVAS